MGSHLGGAPTPRPWSLDPVCPCQWGICGACDGVNSGYGQARHDRCVTRQHVRHYGGPRVIHSALTYKGFVKAVVLTGCRYVCPCGCWKDPAMAAPPPRRIAQPDAVDKDAEEREVAMTPLFELEADRGLPRRVHRVRAPRTTGQ